MQIFQIIRPDGLLFEGGIKAARKRAAEGLPYRQIAEIILCDTGALTEARFAAMCEAAAAGRGFAFERTEPIEVFVGQPQNGTLSLEPPDSDGEDGPESSPSIGSEPAEEPAP